ncbi:MAG TPA: carboxypeptidase regulatory-like domain-containing protein [Verrucomicrobiae bacterium]|nr:carboxypeptidase regulatory-like domain-containing protein [Verrucomicrobiae bacterium]
MKLNHFRWLSLPIVLAALSSNAAVNMTISPSTVSNTYAGTITLQVTGITNGETVLIQKYLDANGNGVVDAGDTLWQQFKLTDGKANVFVNGATSITNYNTPGDTDSTAGQITAALNLPASGFEQTMVGKYLYVLSSPFGNFAPITNSLTVTNFQFGQSFSGSIIANGTNVPNAAVLLFQPVGNNFNPQGGTVADNSGNYQISIPPGFYVLVAFKSNFVANTGDAAVTINAGVNINTNLGLFSADRTISGSFLDASNSTGLAGILVPVMSKNQLTVTFTDPNGNFTAPVVSDQWQVQSSDQAIAFKNYLRQQSKIQVDATSGSVSGVVLGFVKANALFYGTVKDGFGQPMPNTSMFSSENDNNNSGIEQNVVSFPNGQYFAGALSETNLWQVEVSNDQALPNYIYSSPAFDQNGGTNLNPGQAVQANIVALIATNTITGHVQDSSNNPVANVQVFASATIGGANFQTQANTDGSGNYSLNVANGNWSVSLTCQGGNNSLDDYYGPGNYQCPSGQTVNINNNNGSLDFIIYPCTGVQILTASPLSNGQVGIYYSDQFSASSCSGNVNWSVFSGSPPPGLTLYSGGAFNGTPSTNGTFSFTVQANDGNGHSTNQSFSLTINPAPQPPTLGQPSRSGGRFQFSVNATAGQNYTIQMSTNLNSTNWSSILVTNPTMNSFFITDPNATNPARFYRVLMGP